MSSRKLWLKVLQTVVLKANSKQVYMDYHDGKYGINTDPNRGADTFIPFHSGDFSTDNLLTTIDAQGSYEGESIVKKYTVPSDVENVLVIACSYDDSNYVPTRFKVSAKTSKGQVGNIAYHFYFSFALNVFTVDNCAGATISMTCVKGNNMPLSYMVFGF